MASSSSSSSSVVPRRRKGWTYDVFLSFRGEDTRNNFVDHLFAALNLKGIKTFKDDKMLGGGRPISQELVKAIKESRFAVVVFSKNYATSSWCLEELSMIMECQNQLGLKVLPVFYHVDPSDVRKQNGDFATAFETHEDKFKGQMDKVNKWRDALTAAANLSGQLILTDHGYRGESAFINKIVQQILADKQPRGGSRENHLIGIQPCIDALISLLIMEAAEEVHSVGIWGIAGIGKTTIARALFKRIADKFEGSSFVRNVRENSSSKKDICALQQKILEDILGASLGFEIHDPEDGGEVIAERCCSKKVLLVLDDVNDVKQLKFLAATREWFGPGSRIIITTRDQHLLSYANANNMYSPALLQTDQAIELFSRHAFRRSSPPDGYVDLTNRALNYIHGLPLALKVLGSFLCGREASVWGSALDTLAKTSAEVFDTLKLSFDYLNVFEKQIFLDIACFYKGLDVDYVTRILDSFGFDPVIGIDVLVEKSLITISSNNRLDMHDLIQEMGREVVQESAPNSRLWELEKIHDLIGKKRKNPKSWLWHLQKFRDLTWKKENCELEVIEGIVMPWEESKESLSADVFKSMKNLRVLVCYQKFTSREPTFLPDELRWFCWRDYLFSSLPVAHMSKLVGLEMEHGKIKYLWKGKKIVLQNLKFINLQFCNLLERFPDVSGAPNIESLKLFGCQNMVEVDESIGSLKKLLYLDMGDCSKLKRLPSMLHMESLETLILCFCKSLERIPEFSPCMVNLSKLDIYSCWEIEEVPSSIKYLSCLTYLKLDFCRSLKSIPNSIWELKCLNTLRLSFCKKLQKLPDDFQSMESLEELHIDSIHIHAFTNSCYLRKLYLFGDLEDNDFPKNLHGLSSLEELHISGNWKLIQLPESISHLSTLKHLLIEWCGGLQTLYGLPPGIQVLTVRDCISLVKIEDLSKEYKCLNKIHISYCPKLLEDGRYLDKMLDQSFLIKKWAAVDGCLIIHIPGSNIPRWFKEQQDGCKIALKLPPKWQTKIIGFAMCCISTSSLHPDVNLKFGNDEMLVSKSKANNIIETEEVDCHMWTGYIPYSLFEQFRGCNDNDFEGEDWFHMTKGNLVFEISSSLGHVVRCGAKVVYKEDVTSIQQTIPFISSIYWSWKLTNKFTNSFKCREESSKLSLLPRRIGWTYDVFLSFRGEDTRNKFVDHLYEALTLKGIHTFKNDNMLGSEELVKAIKESRFAVVVFSKKYANSSWCLEELSKIMECQNQMGQKVLPVFYHVDPSDVRKQNGDFATAFETHEDKFKGEMDKVNKWRDALSAAASLSGQHIVPDYGDESEFISKIVQQILADIQSRGAIMENNLIGMEPHIDALISLVDMEETEEVRIVGIWGMGGIGKTAIARALFDRIAFKFEGSSFVTNVRENSSSKKDICALQQMILKDILGVFYGFKIHDPEDGGRVIQRRCCSKKVLLVLDDVNDVKQLEFLAATREWFGLGSRIIITTRDQYLLSYANANNTYRPALLHTDQALELFCRHVFHKSVPPEGYEELSIRAIRYSRGLPLALKVSGSFLCGREASVWESALDRLVETQFREVFETLKLSFDGLEFEEKELFLNIACFFRGEDIERVTRIHDCFCFHPIKRIRVLIEKSLIIVSDNKLEMHDLIQEMGWNIVDECAPNSRLWKVEKVHHFTKNRELEGVKAIVLPNKQYSIHQKLLHFSADVFERLENLQLLDVSRKFTSCEPTILPRGLRWLSWNQYPFSSLPLADKCELVGIEMHGGNIEHLWTGRKIMCNLKCLQLQRLDYLTRFPDVSEAPFIERLVLTCCRNLVEVHESLGYHKRLIYVDMSDCRKLNSFPSRIEMDSLETLIMSRCSSLERFPEVTIPTVRLSNICLDGCSRIKELPSSIRYLSSLSFLNLARCTSLKNIPNSICELKCLTSLHLDDCVELLTLPGEFGSIEKLEELRLGFTDAYRALQRLPQSINFYFLKNMCSLRKLDLSWRQTEDKGFPEDLHAFSSLEELNLSGNFELTELPASIYHLSHLKHLELNDCYKLQNLHSLPSGLQVLKASGCSSLEMIEDLPEKYEWLYKIWLVGCWKLPDQEDETNPSKMLLLSFLKKCAAIGHRLSIAIPGNKIPSWFKQQHGCDIPIELPPRWHSRVMGFAISCVFNTMWKIGRDYPVIKFRIVNDGEFVPVADISNPMSQSQILFADGKKTSISKPQNRMKPQFSEVDYINDTSSPADIDTVWIGYIPFGSFEHMCDDWSGMEGNLAISIKLKTGQLPVRCGAHIVYKEDLESIQQTKTCISDYSKLECVRRVGQSYIYEDEF